VKRYGVLIGFALTAGVIALLIYSWGLQSGYFGAKIDNIYDIAGDPGRITSIVITNSKSNLIPITDPALIESFCVAINSTVFEVARINSATSSYFVSFQIYHESNEYWYTLSIPNGRMGRMGISKKVMSPSYTVTDYATIKQWIENNFDSAYLNP